MPQPSSYFELDNRDEIRNIYATDTYIKSRIQDLNGVATVSILSLEEFTVPFVEPYYSAVSVELMGSDDANYLKMIGLIEEGDTPYLVQVAVQNMLRETAYDDGFKLAKACKETVENNPNLNFKCEYLEVSGITNTSYRQKQEWTFIFSFFIAVKNYVSIDSYAFP